ncbi:sigma-70 family RNA polymerase sigma factor [Flavobacteriaceae bacterium AU392]|nr:sigma-70 family RNA polymerase sigma factor [Flavobacteriaceae bacterium]RKM86919.1 sigma-70 family RNA polymerase sigma factor [Flavobacteriaceae bacterium AU392]
MQLVSNDAQIELLVNGDPLILKLLYTKLLPRVIVYIKRNNGTAQDAEEIFQNALFQLITRAKVNSVQIKSSFEGYIFTICKNLWLKELNNRKKEVRNEGVFELKANENDTITSILEQEKWDLFEEKLKLLTDNCRALLKDFFNKVSYKTIVAKFKYSCENVAFQRVFKCKKKLADLIKADSKYRNLVS